ncbi:MAG: NB-ARC domain-containing protein [Anaerolineae bacterium]
MTYYGVDDPQLLADLRTALRRWHRSTLGDEALANRLIDVERRLSADPGLSRSNALQQAVRAALASLREAGRAEQAVLLERHYLRRESAPVLMGAYSLSERSIYYRLQEARVALARVLWTKEQDEADAAADPLPSSQRSDALWRARHLPPRTFTQLFGMEQELAQLLDYLGDRDRDWVISLDGMAGLGKTALAREAVGRMAETDRFADIAWVTVGRVPYTPRSQEQHRAVFLTCGQVLDHIAHQLGDIELGTLALPAKRERVRELLHTASHLVVLDSLETALDCGTFPDWFWDMARPSKLLLTSRHLLDTDVGPTVLALGELDESDGLALIRHEAHRRGLSEVTAAGDDDLRSILAVTGGNPLAITLVVGQLASLPLSRVLSALESVRPSTSSFYQYLYHISWDLLSAQTRHLLLCIAQLPGNCGTWEELSAISALSDPELASAIEELTVHSLLQAAGFEEKSYSIHPLTRHYVISRAALQAGAQGELPKGPV